MSRYGALATDIDFSEKAIEKAQKLNKQLSTKARFIQSDIYQLPNIPDEQFDIVFTSYGVVGWLPDMSRWAKIINHFLKPGGEFILVEFHPVIWMFSYDFKKLSITTWTLNL